MDGAPVTFQEVEMLRVRLKQAGTCPVVETGVSVRVFVTLYWPCKMQLNMKLSVTNYAHHKKLLER